MPVTVIERRGKVFLFKPQVTVRDHPDHHILCFGTPEVLCSGGEIQDELACQSTKLLSRVEGRKPCFTPILFLSE